MKTAATGSLATVKVADREYPLVNARLCRLCQYPKRRAVEEAVVAGGTWSQVARSLDPDAGLTARNIRDHFENGHLPIQEEAVQRLADEQAQERGNLVERAVTPVVSHLALCQAIVGRVSQRIAQSDVEPTIRDGVAAAGVLARFEPPAEAVDENTYLQAFILIQEEAHKIMGDAMYGRFAQALNGNTALADLARRWNEAHGLSPTAHRVPAA